MLEESPGLLGSLLLQSSALQLETFRQILSHFAPGGELAAGLAKPRSCSQNLQTRPPQRPQLMHLLPSSLEALRVLEELCRAVQRDDDCSARILVGSNLRKKLSRSQPCYTRQAWRPRSSCDWMYGWSTSLSILTFLLIVDWGRNHRIN